MNKLPLLVKIALAASIGVGCGLVSPDWGLRAFATVQALFSQFVKFLVPLIILAFVLSFLLGLGIVAVGAKSVYRAFAEFKLIVELALAKVFVPLLPVYMALDGMGTACNLTGDGAIALLVDRFRGPPRDGDTAREEATRGKCHDE